MPEIDQRLAAGVRIADVVRALSENGLPITTATLKSYLYRFRKAARQDQTNVGPGWPGDRSVNLPRQISSGEKDSGSLLTERASTTPGLLRHINTARCLRLLRRGATLSRAELARELGLTRATIGSAMSELIETGLVVETMERPEGGRLGRPGFGVCLNPKGAYSIGIDISSVSLTGVLVDLEMRVVHRINVPVGPHVDDVIKTVEQIAQFPARLLAASGVDPARVQGVCVSAPGLVDQGGESSSRHFFDGMTFH
jgi:DNA-binding XRE family transcriptional regulator